MKIVHREEGRPTAHTRGENKAEKEKRKENNSGSLANQWSCPKQVSPKKEHRHSRSIIVSRPVFLEEFHFVEKTKPRETAPLGWCSSKKGHFV
jgi:hypothetical protein